MRGPFTLSLIAALCGLLAALAPLSAGRAYYEGPVLTLEGEAEANAGIADLTDYTRERLIEGIGWQIATTVRADTTGQLAAIMSRSYTVILPARGDARPLRHMYVLAGFDLLPDCHLLVVIRDPEMYWADYDIKQGRTDKLELVWYDRDWNEYMNQPLDLGAEDGADNFVLSDEQLYMLAIGHPLRDADSEELAPAGHKLLRITLKDGRLSEVPLPEADEAGALPQAWLPLKMKWDDKGRLVVQAGSGLRRYTLEW